MITALVTLIMGGVGGFFFGRGRGLDKEQQAEEERKRLEAELAAAQGGGGPRPLPPIPPIQPGDLILPEGTTLGAGQSPLPTDPYRPPDRTAVIKLPVDAEDFAQLGDAICTCYAALKQDVGPGMDVSHAALRDCMLEAIYPDFQWPPVPGDPTQAQLMWSIADFAARKFLIGNDREQCPKPPAVPPQKGPGGFKAP